MTIKNEFDLIVVGLGAFGASTLLSATQKGLKVLGLDAHVPGGPETLSFGETRLFRQIYTEAPEFVSLTKQARPLWENLEKISSRPLRMKKGHLNFYSKSLEKNFLKSREIAEKNNIEFNIKNNFLDYFGLYEKEAFVIDVEAYFETVFRELQNLNAQVQFNEPVLEVKEYVSHVEVRTKNEVYFAKSVVLSAGPKTKQLLPLHLQAQFPKIILERSPVLWYEMKGSNKLLTSFSVHNDQGHFFAIPNRQKESIKVFNFFPSKICQNLNEHQAELTQAETQSIEDFADQYLGLKQNQILKRHACLYYSTEDSHFLIKKAFVNSRITLATGDSGHAFKFAPLLGQLIFVNSQSVEESVVIPGTDARN